MMISRLRGDYPLDVRAIDPHWVFVTKAVDLTCFTGFFEAQVFTTRHILFLIRATRVFCSRDLSIVIGPFWL